MKKACAFVLFAALMSIQLLFGASIMEGRGNKKSEPTFRHRAETQANPNTSEADMQRPDYTGNQTLNPTTAADAAGNQTTIDFKSIENQAETSDHSHRQIRNEKINKRFAKVQKRLKKSRKQGGSAATGVLSFIFGVTGFIAGFVGVFALAPALIWTAFFLSIAAIILGGIGLGTEEGKGLSIGGFIIGLVTLVLPVLIGGLIVALILAI